MTELCHYSPFYMGEHTSPEPDGPLMRTYSECACGFWHPINVYTIPTADITCPGCLNSNVYSEDVILFELGYEGDEDAWVNDTNRPQARVKWEAGC